MNINELRAEMARNNLTVPKLASGIGISKKTFYRKMNGLSAFNQNEIIKIKEALKLTDSRVIDIFFDEKVS